MKIKAIKRITNFGVFKDYTSTIKPFRSHNLIFGWNYSGKTTLSRIFRSLETGVLPPGFENGSFLIELDDGTTIDSSNLTEHRVRVRVFNTDYIKENLKWEEREGELPPIFILGAKSIEIQNRISSLEGVIQQHQHDKHRLGSERAKKLEELELELTREAARISQELRLGGRFYKNHLRGLLESPEIESWLLDEEEFEKNRSMVLQSEKLADIRPVAVRPKTDVYELTRQLLAECVTPSQTLDRLRADPKLEGWVRQGLEFHRHRDSCVFCGRPLTREILEELDAHFSRDYTDFVERIEQHREYLTAATVELTVEPETAFYQDLRADYRSTLETLQAAIDDYNRFVGKLIEKTEEKLTNPTVQITMDDIADCDLQSIEQAIARINSLIAEHNQRNVEFETERQKATESLKRHYAAEFYRSRAYADRRRELKQYADGVQQLDTAIEANKEELERLSTEISETLKGAEKLQKFMDGYFGNDSPLTIEVTEDNRFQLMRGVFPARSLSEGEKTAIVFSYFVASLHDRETADHLHETIIYIDDPVSSLDANHLYHTYSLIGGYLRGKCAQLFVSTHNHELFKLIKDDFKPKSRNKLKCDFSDSGPQSVRQCRSPLYLVVRHGSTSALEDMDCRLCFFDSEYFYVFKELYNYAYSHDRDDFRAYTMPNLLRRFLDIYVRFNYPETARGSLNISPLIRDPEQEKFVKKIIDELSHSEVVERSMRFPEPQETRQAIQIAFQAIRKIRQKYFEELVGVLHLPSAQLLETAATHNDTEDVT